MPCSQRSSGKDSVPAVLSVFIGTTYLQGLDSYISRAYVLIFKGLYIYRNLLFRSGFAAFFFSEGLMSKYF